MTEKDRSEFIAYLDACTLSQLYGVLDKEYTAHRRDYALLAREAINQREGICKPRH